ncbi:MAG: LysE family translocator [Plesiomonas sp.]|uniref:LysE family translocator n=1 Tax=Plesiomonas sp. TaxID=2486279 RepID=UPI003F352C5F
MLNHSLFFTFILSVLLLLLTPGPVVALITGTAATQGRLVALKTALGTNAASLILIAFSAFVLTGIVSVNNLFLSVLGIIGSLYIAYSSIQALILSAREQHEEAHEKHYQRSGFSHVFLVAISNPKDILFFVSFFPQFIAITDNMTISLTILSIAWMILDLSILSMYIITISYFSTGKSSKILGIVSSLSLIIIAIIGIIYNSHALLSSTRQRALP